MSLSLMLETNSRMKAVDDTITTLIGNLEKQATNLKALQQVTQEARQNLLQASQQALTQLKNQGFWDESDSLKLALQEKSTGLKRKRDE